MSSGGGSATTTGSSAATGTPIKVGEICDCSGQPGFSEYEVPIQDSVKAWADSVNASGGIDGHSIDLITMDDAASPGTSITDVNKLISDKVTAIVDDSVLASAWSAATTAAKIPVVGTDSINAPFDTSPYFFAEGQTNATTLQAMAAIAKETGNTKLGYFYCAESPTCAESVPLLKSAAKADGLDYAYGVSISATAPNYTAQCLAAKQDGVGTLFIADAGTIIQNVAKDCSQQDYYPAYLTEGAGYTPDQATSPGLEKNLWTQYADYPFWGTTAPVQAYNTAMDKYFPGVRENTQTMNEDAFMGWVSAKLVQAGIEAGGLTASGTPSASEVAQGLNSLKNDTLDGLAPPLTFTAGQAHHVNCYFVAHIVNGKPSLANNGKYSCIKYPS